MQSQRKIRKRKNSLIAVTGTPGTGKSKACRLIREFPVINLNDVIKSQADKLEYDSYRESIEISPGLLKKMLPRIDTTTIIEGHLSHLLDPDIVIVLRCSPRILGRRLKVRGWSQSKIRENQEAEAIDVILIEALAKGRSRVFEIDTTHMKPKEVAEAIRGIIKGKGSKFRPGKIDWSEEVLDWY